MYSPPLQPLSVTAELQRPLLAQLSQTPRLVFLASLFTGIRAYEQLGQRAFGPAGKVVVAIIICLHNVGGEDLREVNYGEEGRSSEVGFPKGGLRERESWLNVCTILTSYVQLPVHHQI